MLSLTLLYHSQTTLLDERENLMGIRMKSILIMGILGLLAITAIGAISYQLSVANALKEAKSKSKIILNYAMATKKYMKTARSVKNAMKSTSG